MSVACAVLASCLDSDSYDYTYTDDAAITAFSLGTLNCYTKTVSSKTGNDTIVKSTVTGSKYKFYIDQEKGLIYNPDSLPYGTDGAHVICSVTAYNSGAVAIKSLTSDSLTSYSSSDSVDFSQPREFHAYSLSASAVRKYEVRVNIHQQKATGFEWSARATVAELGQLEGMRGTECGGHPYLMGSDGSSARLYRGSAGGEEWQEVSLPDGFSADAWKSLCSASGHLVADNGGTIVASADGEEWDEVAGTSGARLLGASSQSLFVATDEGQIKKTSDLGQTWTTLTADADAACLPTQDITIMERSILSAVSAKQVLMAGNRSDADYPGDTTALVWSYIEENDSYAEPQPFSIYEWDEDCLYPLPRLKAMQCARSGQSFYALGAGGMGSVSLDPFSAIYRSDDGGATWMASDTVTPPDGLGSSSEAFAFFGDSDGFLWIVCGGSGKVWRGRINQVGWTEEKWSFTE